MQIRKECSLLAMLMVLGCADAAPHDGSSRESKSGSCADPSTEVALACARGELAEADLVLEDGTVQTVTYERIADQAIFEGDIVLNLSEVTGELPSIRPQGVGRASASARWPNKLVPWRLGNPPPPNVAIVEQAIAHWEQNTELRFPKQTNETDYVEFVGGEGCSSAVGRVGGRQRITLASGCPMGSIIHEIGHAIGLWHEQSRSDRDTHLTVLWENITESSAHNFRTFVEARSDGKNINSFDFGSIMLYPSRAFSKNGKPTLVRKDGSEYSVNRKALSAGDLEAVRSMYPPSPATGVVFYADPKYAGAATKAIAKGSYSLQQLRALGFVNDWASSVRIPAGFSVTVYTDDGFKGLVKELTSDTPDLAAFEGLNDRVSSCIIR